ncbi:uncharacterized protein LOC135496011 [Lineus longissimus]|uniref:uncharacterized protein LOC135496011 n=1 Tax=Lineus longissimus TaxID=88925 RepID=UPI002B4D608F
MVRVVYFVVGLCLLTVLVQVRGGCGHKHKHDNERNQGRSSKSISEMAQAKMAKLFPKIDQNNDNAIDEIEIHQFILSMDGVGDVAAKDGMVTKEEFVSANQDRKHKENRFPNELVYGRFDRDNNGDIDEADIKLFVDTFDKNGDGKVSRDEYSAEISKETTPLDEAIEELFVINDMNYNGFWDRLDQHALWNQYDINKDGIITEHEFKRYWNVLYCTNFGPGEYWFKNFDVNQDDVIDEFRDKEDVIMSFDINRDGMVTEEEMKIEIKKLMKRIPDKKKWKCPEY